MVLPTAATLLAPPPSLLLMLPPLLRAPRLAPRLLPLLRGLPLSNLADDNVGWDDPGAGTSPSPEEDAAAKAEVGEMFLY